MFNGSKSLAISRGGSRAAATSKMEHFVIIVNGWKLLRALIAIKSSNLDIGRVSESTVDKE